MNVARFFAAFLSVFAVLPPALAEPPAIDLTADFIKRGAVIEDLAAIQVSDIVVIRGKTNDRAKFEAATRIAETLGFHRVANLVVVRDDVSADAAIVFTAQRRLELEPALAGCRFRVDCSLGVIRLTGRVHRDAQVDLAVRILSRIEGVREVHPAVVRL